MQVTCQQFVLSHAATHDQIDCEDFREIVQFDQLCETCWPIWVAKLHGHPVAWFNEIENTAHIS